MADVSDDPHQLSSQSYSSATRERLASILTTHSRTFSFSAISEMSSLDSGVRRKPCLVPERSLEEQLSETQEDLQRTLEFAYVVVEENNALKNILKGAVVICEDGDMKDFCETLISIDHELPILRSWQTHNRTLVQSSTSTCADVTSESIPKHTATTSGSSQAPLLETSGSSVNGASASIAPELVTSSAVAPLDVGTSVRKLAGLALTESWRARNQEDIEAELHEARNKGLRSKGRGKKSSRKKVLRGATKSKSLSGAKSPRGSSSKMLVHSAELDMPTIDEERPGKIPSTPRVDIPKRSSPTVIPRGNSPTVTSRGNTPRNSPRGSPLLKFTGRTPSTSSQRGDPEFIEEAAVDVTSDRKEHEPRFYTDDLLRIIEERNDLKERVLQLEDHLEDMQRQVSSLSPPSTLGSTFSPTQTTPLGPRQYHTIGVARRGGGGGGGGAQRLAGMDTDLVGVLPSSYQFALRPVVGPKEHYITDVSVIRCQKQLGSKFVYVIHTTWSDRNRYEIYRRYGEFFTFQNTLTQLYPVESGKYKSSERVIPTLPTTDNLLSILGRTDSESVLKSRLDTINSYCTTLLLHLDTAISHSVFVINFFKPYPGDRQLERLERPRGQTLTVSLYPLTVPAGSCFEQYTVLADHKGTGNEIAVKAGEIVKVIKKEANGWWLVSKAGRRKCEEDESEEDESTEELGYVPGTFLKKYEGLAELQNSAELENRFLGFVSSMALQELEIDPALKYVAVEDYATDDPRQISFTMGTTLIVVEKSEDGWWLVSHDGREGWAPSSYLEPLEPATETGEKEESQESPLQSIPGQVYKTREAYTAQLDDEISFPKNASLEVLEKSITGWWSVRYKDMVGMAPASLLRLAPHHKVPQELKFALSVDLGHAISGINQPPPRRKFINQRQRSKSVNDDDSSVASVAVRGLPVEALETTRDFGDSRFRSRVCSGVPPWGLREQLALSPPIDFKALVRSTTLRAKSRETREMASTLAEKRRSTVTAVDVRIEVSSKSEEPTAVALEREEKQLRVEEAGERTGSETEGASNAEDERQVQPGREKHGGDVDGQDESADTAETVKSCESESQSHCSMPPECGRPERAHHCTGSVCEFQTTD